MKVEVGVAVIIETLIAQAIEKAGSKSKLARELGINVQTVFSWVRGSVPRLNHLQLLEKYLVEEKCTPSRMT